ncbi:MAG: glycosyltransferase family 1 protein [Pseudomonadota bacterium]
MKILVNAIPLSGLLTGISRCLRCLYLEMGRLPGVSVSYFTGTRVVSEMPPLAKSDRWIRTTASIWKLPDPIVFFLRCAHWLRYEYFLEREIRKGKFDLYHETAFVPAKTKRIPVVYTIYDLSLISFRDKHPRERVWFHDFFFHRRIEYASRILTISEFIKTEIVRMLGISSNRISAVPLAPDQIFYPRESSVVKRVLKRLNLPDRYFLFVGSLEPRKNLNAIIQAMALQKDPLPLVMTGWVGWGDKFWMREIDRLGLEKKVFMTGYVDDETLAALYSGARGFVYPSFYEGFGLPVLEAMACGCPVVCANAASLPEVVGDAAIRIDPHDAAALARAMEDIAVNDQLHRSLTLKGLCRAKEFSWRKTAGQTLNVFEKAVAGYREP